MISRTSLPTMTKPSPSPTRANQCGSKAAAFPQISFLYFSVKPVLGRTFLPTDDRHGAPDTVVLSNCLLARALSGQPEDHWPHCPH